MSAGPSLYRRHRPRSFADVVGQEHVVRTLGHAVEQNKVHHAYLFVGSRGTGKTSMAKILASCLNCVDGPTVSPCGTCDSCVAIANATSLDVIEMDAASNNSVDDIRELRDKVAFAPVSGKHKVYILDEAHMLSSQAWNAFLKTLEEPPPRTIFVLATTEAQKVLPTVVDRCHRFDFGRPSAEQVAEVVRRVADKESIDIDPGAVALIARHATGSFRDALGTLEQLLAYAGDERIKPDDVLAVLGVADAEQLFGALDAVIAREPAGALAAAAALAASGRDPGQVLRDLEVHARELLTVQVLGRVPAELRVTPDRDARLVEQARALAATDAVRLLDLVSAALAATANGAQPRIQLELVLVRAAAPQFDPSQAALLSRLERLEQRPAVASPATASAQQARNELASAESASDEAANRGDVPAASPEASKRPEEPVAPPKLEISRLEAEPATADRVPPEPAREALAAPAEAGQAGPAEVEEPGSPVSAAGAQSPAAGGASGIEQIRSLWPAVVEIIRGQNAMLADLVAGARPVSAGEAELVLAFPLGAAFHKRKAEQSDHMRITIDAVRNVTGTSYALRYELAEVVAEGQPTAADDKLSDEELVRRFVEEFDAQEIEES